MSAVDLYTAKADVIVAMKDVRARTARVIRLANAADSAVLGAISLYQQTGNAAYLSCIAAERTWNGFQDDYDGMAASLGVLNGESGLGSYSSLLSTTNADHRLSTPCDIGFILGAVANASRDIDRLCKDATAANGPELGAAALELASYAHQSLIWKLGIHWPEIYGTLWPRTDMRVMRIERKDVGDDDYRILLASLNKGEEAGGSACSFWYSYLWAHAGETGGIRDTSWAYPPTVAAGDKLRIEAISPPATGELTVFGTTFTINVSNARNAHMAALYGKELTVAACEANTYDLTLAEDYGCEALDFVVQIPEWKAEMPLLDDGSEPLYPLSSLMLRKVYSAGAPEWPSSGDPTP